MINEKGQKVLTNSGKSKVQDVPIVDETVAEVKDPKALQAYLKLENSPILTTKKAYTASNGEIFYLNVPWKILAKKAKDTELSEEETNKIHSLRKLYSKVLMKKSRMLLKAYGKAVKIDGKTVTARSAFDLRKAEILELFGRMFSVKEVFEVLLTRFQMRNIKLEQLRAYRMKHADEIQEKIEKFKVEYTDMRLAIKRGRLEELVWLYNKRKRLYELSTRGDDHRILLTTLEQIRKEVEGDALRLEGNMTLTIDQVIEDQVQKQLMHHTNIKEIVISRIIGRSQIPIREFLAQLEKNWYTKNFNDIDDIDYEEIESFPSTKPYDFDHITRVNLQREARLKREQDNPQDATPTEAESQNEKVGLSIKAALIKKLAQKQQQLRMAKDASSELNDIDLLETNREADSIEYEMLDKRKFNKAPERTKGKK